MNCSETSSLLSLYLDEELDDLRRKQVELHLQRCPVCSHDLATLAGTVRVIRVAAGREPENDAPGIAQPSANFCGASTSKAKRRRPHE